MNKLNFILIILAGTLLLSCVKKISIENVNEFKKGMSYNESGLDRFVVNKNYTFDFKLGKDSYSTISYEYQIENRNHTYFTFVFRNDKLEYWGYPDELNREPDEILNKVGDTLCRQLINDLVK
jgi:hypothetical protein